MPCSAQDLRGIALFERLDERQLRVLCAQGRVATLPAGMLCAEGEPATSFYALVDGELAISKRSAGADVEVERTARRGAHFGAWLAVVDESERLWDVSVRLTVTSRVFVMDAPAFASFMRAEFPMLVGLLEQQLADRSREVKTVGQRDTLLALGCLTAGLSSQLAAPAAMTQQTVAEIQQNFVEGRHKLGQLVGSGIPAHGLGALMSLEDAVTEHVAKTYQDTKHVAGQSFTPPTTDTERQQRGDLIARWLVDHHIAGGQDRVATFVEGGLDTDWLEQAGVIADEAGLDSCAAIIDWLHHAVQFELRLQRITESCERISALIDGVKQYSQMDRGEYRSVDVHEMLRSTAVMFGDKVAMPGKGKPVTVVKYLDRSLPELHCCPGELNQVWTHIFMNALDAMGGAGTLTMRTLREGDAMIRVEISDDGPGIAPHLIDRVFEPFFTTKPLGQGAGLGLDLVRHIVVDKHHGTIEVRSRPGETTFIVCLPLASQHRD
ncbi:ATP-binding protein [Mycobacterium sp. 236(2023)]|uniref:ATP-binding protein n=1 Tax=Mycobacterium sp. 236(2023) TaxID=3038163 RepID=UPI002414FB47|nr:ATP-binding protein [Mycobacterium sp. 236(2023)]MDG4668863.1 ATP-binding protein [Mycobacterium sp. 236(2023)]